MYCSLRVVGGRMVGGRVMALGPSAKGPYAFVALKNSVIRRSGRSVVCSGHGIKHRIGRLSDWMSSMAVASTMYAVPFIQVMFVMFDLHIRHCTSDKVY